MHRGYGKREEEPKEKEKEKSIGDRERRRLSGSVEEACRELEAAMKKFTVG